MARQAALIAGWAADASGSDSGVDQVLIFLDAPGEDGGVFIGSASYGSPRTDVVESTGMSDWLNSGYSLVWNASTTPGLHAIYVYAHAIGTDQWSYASSPVLVQ